MKVFSFLLIIFFSLATSIFSQVQFTPHTITTAADSAVDVDGDDDTDVLPAWLNIGLGVGNLGIAFGSDFNFFISERLISQVSLVHNRGINLGLSHRGVENSITSLGFLVGMRSESRSASAAILVGASGINGFRTVKKRECHGEEPFRSCFYRRSKHRFNNVGLIGNAQLFLTPFSSFGLGLDISGCLNPEINFAIVLLSLQFGGYTQ